MNFETYRSPRYCGRVAAAEFYAIIVPTSNDLQEERIQSKEPDVALVSVGAPMGASNRHCRSDPSLARWVKVPQLRPQSPQQGPSPTSSTSIG